MKTSQHWPATGSAESASFYEALQELLRIYQFRDRDSACYGAISPNDCYALEAVARDGPMRVNDLAAALGLHKSNASRLAASLVERGLLRRDDDEDDPRAARLALTERGDIAHAAVRARVERAHKRVLDDFSPTARRQAIKLLRRLADEARSRIGTMGCEPKASGDLMPIAGPPGIRSPRRRAPVK